ncbi:hypothetical protein HZA57_09050 [Candidatus Poribacteria bacterium]|nr:hypothetical protein [Candidatus Poribacteria bacterium]
MTSVPCTMSQPVVESATPAEVPIRRASLPVLGLFWLNLKCVLRAWRWRALLAICLVIAYLLERGIGFGEGTAVAFPGGERGVLLFGLLLAVGTAILAVDLAGQVDRHRARQMQDSRPASGLGVQAARLGAVVITGFLVAAAITAFPFLSPFSKHDGLLLLPSAVFMVAVLAPIVFTAAGAGLLGRSISRTDGGGVLCAAILLSPVLWNRLWVTDPAQIFMTASKGLGILEPAGTLAADALGTVLTGVLMLGLSGFVLRRYEARTPLRLLEPPRHSAIPALRRALASLGVASRGFGWNAVASLALVLAGTWGAHRIATERAMPTMNPDWNRMTEPSGAVHGTVYPPRIAARSFNLTGGDRPTLLAELQLKSALGGPQELAGLTFGPALEVTGVERLGGGTAAVASGAVNEGLHAMVVRFDPPLGEEPSGLRVTLRPTRAGLRAWEKTRHPVYASFHSLPLWFGEGVLLRYAFNEFRVVEQAAPFDIRLPDVSPRQWVCGSAAVVSEAGVAKLNQPRAGRPTGLFAARLATARSDASGLDVRFVVLPEHEELAKALHVAFERRFERLFRAFGPSADPLVFYEVPAQTTSDPMAVTSASLDRLETLLEKYSDPDPELTTAPEFDKEFARLHAGALEAILTSRFTGFEHPQLLRDAWISYLNTYGFMEGQTRDLERRRRDFILVPWEWLQQNGRFPFDLVPREEAAWRGPLFDAARPTTMPRPPAARALAFHHMTRGLLGDTKYVEMLRLLVREYAGQPLTLDAFRTSAEKASGKELGWFFDQWLAEGVVPEYRLLEAQVVLAENPETRDLEYTTSVKFANRGDGRMPVPIVLATEADTITETVELGPQEERRLQFVTRDRPLSVTIDPQGWIVQMPPFDERAKRPVHPQLFLKAVKEL